MKIKIGQDDFDFRCSTTPRRLNMNKQYFTRDSPIKNINLLNEWSPSFRASAQRGTLREELKLCIEVDGDQHYFSENKEKEERRTNFIEKKGIKILRILNSDVKSRFTDTVRYIEAVCHERAVELNLDDSIFEIEGK